MIVRTTAILATSTAVLLLSSAAQAASWQTEFAMADCNFQTTGQNGYFVMEPGYQLVLEGGDTKLQITVLDETKTVDGVVTRVIEEREWDEGELFEVSRNYFAICESTGDVFYFGEDVDFYKDGKVTKHDGSWLAGVDGNKAGLIMAGKPELEMRYYQEIAPDVAMDRAEVISQTETCETPAGTFSNCLKVKEGTALNILETEFKFYAPGIGLIRDSDVVLTKFGMINGN